MQLDFVRQCQVCPTYVDVWQQFLNQSVKSETIKKTLNYHDERQRKKAMQRIGRIAIEIVFVPLIDTLSSVHPMSLFNRLGQGTFHGTQSWIIKKDSQL